MNKTLLRGRKWRIQQIDELGEQKYTQKLGILQGPTKKWRIDANWRSRRWRIRWVLLYIHTDYYQHQNFTKTVY